MVESSDALTIIVPTRNRSAFLRRLLRFMSQMKVRSTIVVTDSSDSDQLDQNDRIIASHSSDLKLKHVPDARGMIPKCRHAVEAVETPYTVFCADDDFLLPDSASACIDFLETHHDYGCAMGSWVYLNHESGNRCHQTRCFALDDANPLQRSRKLAKDWFSNFYAVYRTEPLSRAWVLTDESTDYERARVFPETLLAQLCALNCKMAILPNLHSLLALHDDNEHRKTPLIADESSAAELYARFENAFTCEIVRCSGCDESTARSFVNHQYGFLGKRLSDSRGKLTGWARLKKNLKNQIYTNRDRFFASPVNIWLRRRLDLDGQLCQTLSWQTAFGLATRYPAGIESGDVSPHSHAA